MSHSLFLWCLVSSARHSLNLIISFLSVNSSEMDKRNTHIFSSLPIGRAVEGKNKEKTRVLVYASGAQKNPVYISLSPPAIVRNTTAPWSKPRPPTQQPRSLPVHHNRTVNTLLSQFRALKWPRCVLTQGPFCSSS